MDISVSQVVGLIWNFIADVWGATWWFWIFWIIFPVARSTWMYWKNCLFEHAEMQKNTVVVEMRIPREIVRSPRSMDQFFQSIAYLRNSAGNLGEKYLDGEVTRWYTFEIVSFSGEVHFYMKLPKKQKMMVEAALFANYPEIELLETEDYIHRLPHHISEIKAQNMDLWGSELVLSKEGGYPLNTYMEFETPDEQHQTDPFASFIESLGKVRKGEFLGIQFICAPESQTSWGKQFAHIVEELRTPQTVGGHGHSNDPAELIKAVSLQKSPGQTDVLKAIERNLSKPAFSTLIRFIYISPKNLYYDTFARRSIMGSFNQYGSADLNSFVINGGITTKVDFWNWPYCFSKWRSMARKQRVLHTYLEREHLIHEWVGRVLTSHPLHWNTHSQACTISTEGMASLYHPPASALVTTAPHTRRVESKKMGAPAGLPIYAEEDVLGRFK